MIKKAAIVLIIMIGFIFTGQSALALGQPKLEVNIISPNHVKDYPGKEENILVQVTNHTNRSIKDLMVYITMADTKKKWTVNLEDYSADKPEQIKEVKAGETKEISLPIRFVYNSNYYLYVTATSTTQGLDIYSSKGIPIEIMGNTKINPLTVQIVSIGMPLVILLIGMWSLKKKRGKRVVGINE